MNWGRVPVMTRFEMRFCEKARKLTACLATAILPVHRLERSAMSSRQLIRVGHSPDPDDAFMFHALANDKIDTGRYQFTHQLEDIETLNRRAFRGELELTAVSLHGYAFVTDKYALCACGASMGDGYGPMVVSREVGSVQNLAGKTVAVPGTLTTASSVDAAVAGESRLKVAPLPESGPSTAQTSTVYYIVRPFDEILNVVERGEADFGLIIHEGQLTYQNQD